MGIKGRLQRETLFQEQIRLY